MRYAGAWGNWCRPSFASPPKIGKYDGDTIARFGFSPDLSAGLIILRCE